MAAGTPCRNAQEALGFPARIARGGVWSGQSKRAGAASTIGRDRPRSAPPDVAPESEHRAIGRRAEALPVAHRAGFRRPPPGPGAGRANHLILPRAWGISGLVATWGGASGGQRAVHLC